MEELESLVHDFEQETASIQPTLVSTTETDTSEQRPSLDRDDDTTETIPRTNSTESNDLYNTDDISDFDINNSTDSARHSIGGDGEPTTSDDAVEENQHNVIPNDDNDTHPILDQSADLVEATADIHDRLDTTPTPSLSTMPGTHLDHDSHQNDIQHSTLHLNDTTNQVLQPSTSATTTTTTSTTGTQTDAYYYYMDQIPHTDDNGHENQQQPDDTPPQQDDDDNNNAISPLVSATPTSSNLDDQPLNRTATVGSDEQTLSEPAGPRHEWESDRQASECRRCGRRFNFLIRRHHCRRCGQIVCDRCSSHRVRLPVEEIVEDPLISSSHYPIIALNPQRVCEACIRIPIKADPTSSSPNNNNNNNSSSNSANGSHQQQYPMNMQRSNSQQSLMVECPVCGNGLLGMRKEQQEYHLNQCLNTGSSTLCPPRYIIYTLMEGAAQIGDECPICFEEFQVGNKIARMVCLCSYHRRCLRTWLERGKGCPIHFDSNIGTY